MLRDGNKLLGLITLPSISAIGSGLIFKSASIYTVYMIPAIWLGNFALVYLYRKLSVQKKVNYILTSIAAILLKAAIIYLCFRLFTLVTVIPGTGKVFTALIAAVIGFGINLGFCQKGKVEEQ